MYLDDFPTKEEWKYTLKVLEKLGIKEPMDLQDNQTVVMLALASRSISDNLRKDWIEVNAKRVFKEGKTEFVGLPTEVIG